MKNTFGTSRARCSGRLVKWKKCTISLVVTFVSLCGASPALAGTCTPTNVTNGADVNCTGTFTNETYVLKLNKRAVTITTDGTWSYSGALSDDAGSGILTVDSSSANIFNKLQIVNDGSITWDDVNVNNVDGAVNGDLTVIGTTLENETSQYVKLYNNGSISAIAGAYNIDSLSGMSMIAKDGNLTEKNTGTITLDGSLITNSSARITGMYAFASGNAQLKNTGTITVTAADQQAEGMNYTYDGGDGSAGYNSGSISLENTSTGTIKATSNSTAYGMVLIDKGTDDASQAMTDATLTNAGTITVTSSSGNDGDAAGFYIKTRTADATVYVNNSGTVNSSGHAIFTYGTTESSILVTNTGTLNGRIKTALGDDAITNSGSITGEFIMAAGDDVITNTGSIVGTVRMQLGDDTFEQSAGAYEGTLNTGRGDDIVTLTGGTFTGTIIMRQGSDSLTIDGLSDLSTFTNIDGGDADSGETDIDTLTLANVSGELVGAKVANWESVTLDNAEITFTDGTLETGADIENDQGLILTNGSLLHAEDSFTLIGDMLNGATISTVDGDTSDVISVSGDYVGNGGTLAIDVEMGDDSTGSADTLVISGNASGTTYVTASVAGGTAAQTDTGILVVDVSGTSTSDAFTLTNAVESGAYVYDLAYESTDQNWYLRSEYDASGSHVISSMGAVYESAPSVLLSLADMPTLEQRIGQRQWLGQANGPHGVFGPQDGAWIRFITTQSKITPAESNAEASYKNTTTLLQAGWDAPFTEINSGELVFGAVAQFGTVSADIENDSGKGTITGQGFGLGLTGTWYGNRGTYVDLQSMASFISADYATDSYGTLAENENALLFAGSIEAGQSFSFSRHFAVIPQAQLTMASLVGGDFTDDNGSEVDLGNTTSVVGRIGAAFEFRDDEGELFGFGASATNSLKEKLYAKVNLLHDFSGDSSVSLDNVDLSASGENNWGEVALGGSLQWDDNKTLYSEGSFRRALSNGEDNWGASFKVGLRLNW